MKRKHITSLFAMLGLVIGWQAVAQDQHFNIEFGYQTVDVTGNEQAYLSQENMDDGVFLNSLYFEKTGGMFDHTTVSASGFGAKTNGRFQLNLHKAEKIKIHLNYFSLNQYSALPGAGLVPDAEGLTFGDFTFDRDRHQMHLELEFRPGKTWSPILGVHYSQFEGPSTSTYHVGEDEFKLQSDFEETDTEYYAGILFKLEKWQGEIVQGFRDLDGSETRTLAAGAGMGDSDGTILGQDIHLDQLTGTADWETSSPITRLNLSGQVGDKLEIRAAFRRGDMEMDTTETEALSGNLVRFQIQRYYSGQREYISSHTENPNMYGKLDLAYRITPKVKAKFGVKMRSHEVTGQALVETMYLDSVTFGTDHSSDFQTNLNAQTSMEREDDEIYANLTGTIHKNVKFWLAGSIANQDIDIDPDLSEIVIPGGQGGEFDREITRLQAGFQVKVKSAFKLRASYENSDADQAVIRTDYLDRDKLSVRLQARLGDHVSLFATGKKIEAENKESSLSYELESTEYAFEAMFHNKAFQLSANYGIFDLESNHTILRPESFTYEPSVHVEDGEELGINTTFTLKALRFSGSFTRYENTGIYGFDLDQIFADARIKLSESWTAGLQVFLRDYALESTPEMDFDAERFALIVRYSL